MNIEITESQPETWEVSDMNAGEPFMDKHGTMWIKVTPTNELELRRVIRNLGGGNEHTEPIKHDVVPVVCLMTGELHTMLRCLTVFPLDGGFTGSKRLIEEKV